MIMCPFMSLDYGAFITCWFSGSLYVSNDVIGSHDQIPARPPMWSHTFHDLLEKLIGTGLQGGSLRSGNQRGTWCEVGDLGPEPWNWPATHGTKDCRLNLCRHLFLNNDWLHHYHTWSHSISNSHIFKSFSHLFSNSHPNLASLILPLWSELSHAGSARRFMVGNPSAKSNLDKKSWAEKLFRVQLLQLLVHLFSMCLKSHCILLACRGLTIQG